MAGVQNDVVAELMSRAVLIFVVGGAQHRSGGGGIVSGAAEGMTDLPEAPQFIQPLRADPRDGRAVAILPLNEAFALMQPAGLMTAWT